MGSQSVTNFSAIRMERIRQSVRGYSPKSPDAEAQVRRIGEAAVGTLVTTEPSRVPSPKSRAKGKGRGGAGGGRAASAAGLPANEFLQALTSPSVEAALDLITELASEVEAAEDPEEVYAKYKVKPGLDQPLGRLTAALTKAFSDTLSETQAETESAFAARDAIFKTIVDVVSAAFPNEREPVEVDRDKLIKAIRQVPRREVVIAYMENVAAALINMVLAATRSLPPAQTEEIKRKIRKGFVPELIQQLVPELTKAQKRKTRKT